jgi:hypothetical protein
MVGKGVINNSKLLILKFQLVRSWATLRLMDFAFFNTPIQGRASGRGKEKEMLEK